MYIELRVQWNCNRGISENSSESNLECKEKTRKFMVNELRLDDDRVRKIKYIRVHMMGVSQKNTQHNRPIIILFQHYAHKSTVWAAGGQEIKFRRN